MQNKIKFMKTYVFYRLLLQNNVTQMYKSIKLLLKIPY